MASKVVPPKPVTARIAVLRQLDQRFPNRWQFLGVLGLLPMATDDFFRARLDTMIDLRHPLAVLASRMPWAEIEIVSQRVV
ncbi:MAG: hypothetical protein NZ533_12210 [Casimicrobiaceae bacterium]|nr:hypothetical protein [Casimicrobiaceae bacterium]